MRSRACDENITKNTIGKDLAGGKEDEQNGDVYFYLFSLSRNKAPQTSQTGYMLAYPAFPASNVSNILSTKSTLQLTYFFL